MHEDTSQVQLHLETHIHLCEGSQALCVNTLKALLYMFNTVRSVLWNFIMHTVVDMFSITTVFNS